jgi:hypothetical protein
VCACACTRTLLVQPAGHPHSVFPHTLNSPVVEDEAKFAHAVALSARDGTQELPSQKSKAWHDHVRRVPQGHTINSRLDAACADMPSRYSCTSLANTMPATRSTYKHAINPRLVATSAIRMPRRNHTQLQSSLANTMHVRLPQQSTLFVQLAGQHGEATCMRRLDSWHWGRDYQRSASAAQTFTHTTLLCPMNTQLPKHTHHDTPLPNEHSAAQTHTHTHHSSAQ